jgi:FtsZ-interacting cell division protein ZipA
MIELKLTVTAEQMLDIAHVMAGTYQRPTVGQVVKTVADGMDITHKPENTNTGDAVDLNELHERAAEVADEEEPTDPKSASCAAATDTPQAGNPSQNTTTQTATDTPAQDVTVAGVTLDSAGLPWDVRIHASTKTTKADGTWKRKVRVSDELVASVETELRAAMTATPGDEVPPPPATEADPSAALAAAGNTDAVPPPPAATSPKTFPELLPLVSAAKANGTISDDQIAVAVTQVGLAKFGELAVRPELIPQFAAAVGV